MRWRRALIGLTIALAIVAGLIYGVGWDDVWENVGAADSRLLALATLVGLGILVFRGLTIERLLVPVSGSATGIALATCFLSGYFARSALPWGRSTGTPVMAYLLAANSDSEFEDNLAVVASAEVFGFLASLVVALTGLGLYALDGETPMDALSGVLLGAAAAVVVIVVLVALLSTGRSREYLLSGATRIEGLLRRVPIRRLSPEPGTLPGRFRSFFETIDGLRAAKRTLLVAFAIALVGWVVNALPLYLCLLALGVDAPVTLAFALAPLASLGGVLPLPGGTGGIEVVLTTLLVAVGGLTGDVATATAILYRLTTYWANLGVSGFGALYLSMSGSRLVTV